MSKDYELSGGQQCAASVVFQDAPAPFDGVVFAVIRRVVRRGIDQHRTIQRSGFLARQTTGVANRRSKNREQVGHNTDRHFPATGRRLSETGLRQGSSHQHPALFVIVLPGDGSCLVGRIKVDAPR